ncbi:nuclear transport factor 2 family protein [Streptomyces sp. NPDC004658]|uniref:nuclear transport factor 2 family protein n=1 Tax=Streptomyces sp. NPDC004658 TaxID=3154672 RepID=UPI0033B4A8A1
MSAELTDPAVAAFVAAVNAGDREAFFAALTDDATMSDDGTDRDLRAWAEREIFSSNGRMDVEDVSADGRTLMATYTNSTWGSMRTRWVFTVSGGRVSRFETGQA